MTCSHILIIISGMFFLCEVKMTVWDCDIFKSSCLDDINFGFDKNLWEDLKGDFMKFLAYFYLVESSSCTFIDLILKVVSR